MISQVSIFPDKEYGLKFSTFIRKSGFELDLFYDRKFNFQLI
jgi:hypothetical protein